jgi:hypothetical protein
LLEIFPSSKQMKKKKMREAKKALGVTKVRSNKGAFV